MSSFMTGDKVQLKSGTGFDDLEGLSGTLIPSDNDMFLHLKFDNPPSDFMGYLPVYETEIVRVDG